MERFASDEAERNLSYDVEAREEHLDASSEQGLPDPILLAEAHAIAAKILDELKDRYGRGSLAKLRQQFSYAADWAARRFDCSRRTEFATFVTRLFSRKKLELFDSRPQADFDAELHDQTLRDAAASSEEKLYDYLRYADDLLASGLRTRRTFWAVKCQRQRDSVVM